METSKGKQCQILWFGEQPHAIARQLDFCYIFFYNFKALKKLLNSADNTIPKKEQFCFNA
jgi:hypothetical protein